MENFKVRNRYGEYHEFVKLNDNEYKLIPLYDTMRVIFEEGDTTMTNIYAVDPDGGPFMTKGYEFDNGMKIEDIQRNEDKSIAFIITHKTPEKK